MPYCNTMPFTITMLDKIKSECIHIKDINSIQFISFHFIHSNAKTFKCTEICPAYSLDLDSLCTLCFQ